MLYLLQDDNPRFKLLLHNPNDLDMPNDGDENDPRLIFPELHLTRFLDLRAQLRTAFPTLTRISDPLLLALLCKMGKSNDSKAVKNVAISFACTRMMPYHPESRDGKPTDAERQLGGYSAVIPQNIGRHNDDNYPAFLPGDTFEWYCGKSPRGLSLLIESEGGRTKREMKQILDSIDAFHRAQKKTPGKSAAAKKKPAVKMAKKGASAGGGSGGVKKAGAAKSAVKSAAAAVKKKQEQEEKPEQEGGSGAPAAEAAPGFEQTGAEMEELRAHIAAQDARIAALEARLAEQQQGGRV